MRGGHRVMAGSRVAEEAVVGVGDLDVYIVLARLMQRLSDRKNLVGPKMFIATSPEKQHGRTQLADAIQQARIIRIGRDAAAVKRDRAGDWDCHCCQDGGAASHAEADRSDRKIRTSAIGGEPCVGRPQVRSHSIVGKRADVAPHRGKIVVAAFKPRSRAMK